MKHEKEKNHEKKNYLHSISSEYGIWNAYRLRKKRGNLKKLKKAV